MGAKAPVQKYPKRARTTVGVISPWKLFRDCLVACLARELGLCAVDCLGGGPDSLSTVVGAPLDVLLLDLTYPDSVGLCRSVLRTTNAPRIVAIGFDGERDLVGLAEAG